MKKMYLAGFVVVAIVAFGVMAVPKIMAEKQNNNGKIPGQYIVVFKDGVDPDTATDGIVKNQGLGHLFTYKHALKGFAATIPQEKLDKVKNDPRVAYVTEDRIVTADGKPSASPIVPPAAQQLPTGIKRINAAVSLSNTGKGVGVAVIDTGIDLTHPDLQSNIAGGINCSTGGKSYADGYGHGTHVAGTIAALNNKIGVVGVAPDAKLLAVRVLDNNGFGSTSSVICGIDWVTANAARYNIKVANMSLGGSGTSDDKCGNTNNDAMHKAICGSRDKGITYVVAAGNGDSAGKPLNANIQTPAAYDDAVITVSALADYDGLAGGISNIVTSYGADDTFASFSNYGSVVDLGAPGVNIYSTYKGGGYAYMSGTSMATPHVSGAVALYLSKYPQTILNETTFGVVRDALRTMGEISGHTSSSLHPEPVLQVGNLY